MKQTSEQNGKDKQHRPKTVNKPTSH